MTRDEILARLNGLPQVGEAHVDALGEYLQILQPAPEPRLSAARRRVLGEAARTGPSGARRNPFLFKMAPRVSFTWALALFLLVGGIATATFASNSHGATNFLFDLASTPTVAWTRAPLNEASATVSLAPTPLNAPAPLTGGLTITPAPAPTPVATLPLIETAQSQPAN